MDIARIEVRPRDPDVPMHGKNCMILMDGKEVAGLTFFSFRVGVGRIAQVRMQMFANVDVAGDAEIKCSESK